MAKFKKIKGTSFQYFALIAILAIFALLGIYCYYLEFTFGGYTGLNNRVPWGIVNAGIPYFIGLSAGSLIVSALAEVVGIRKYKILSRVATFLAAAWIVAAITCIALDIGMPYNFLNAVVYFNPTSIFSWNAFLYSSYFVICAVYLLFQFQERESATKFMAFVAVFWAILVHSGTGAIYSFVYSKDLWHSALTPPMFIICAITSGLGLLIATLQITFKYTQRALDPSLLRGLGLIFAGLVIALGYMLSVEVLEKSYIPALKGAISFVYFNPADAHFWSFWLLILFGIVLPVAIIVNPKTGRKPYCISTAGIMHAAMVFAERFYLIIPGQVYPEEYLPGYMEESLHTLEGLVVAYTPTVCEWMMLLGLVALVFLIYSLGIKFFAILPETAMLEESSQKLGVRS